MQASSTERLHYLDAVRAVALLLGVVFHASLSFVPVFIGWAVMDINTSELISVFAIISHSFRLEVFFLIAGFFAHMSYHRSGKLSRFLKSRLLRIALPFVLFWFLLKPLIEAGWIMGMNSYSADLQIVSSLKIAYSNLQFLPEGIFVSTHLWFLYYLLLTTFGVVAILTVLNLKAGLLHSAGKRIDLMLRHWVAHKFMLPLLLVPTIGCLWFMNRWGVDTPDRSLIPHIPVLALYSLFFCLGWLLHRVPDVLVAFTRVTLVKVGLMSVAAVCSVMLTVFEPQYGHPYYTWLKLGFVVSYAIMMWTLVLLLIGVCGRLFSKQNGVVQYFADSSYWMYLVHLPIVVFLQVMLSNLAIFWWLKFVIIIVSTVFICLLSYDAVVRDTAIGQLLNGKRKPRVLLAFNRAKGLFNEAR